MRLFGRSRQRRAVNDNPDGLDIPQPVHYGHSILNLLGFQSRWKAAEDP